MAITYPLSIPTNVGIENINLRAVNAVAYSMSPFTFVGQAQAFPGQMWQADITLPPMKRQDAEEWVSFLVALRGQLGTFLLGDPNCKAPRGSASIIPGTPAVKGASQTGNTLDIDGLPLSQSGYLLAGDYLQLGSGENSRLYKVLSTVDTDGSGEATVDIWPDLRSSPEDNDLVTLTDTVGRFRLSSNETSWTIGESSSYGISFGAVEAL